MLSHYLEELLKEGRVFDLGMPYFTGMPHHPNQPPFAHTLLKKHGDITVGEEKISFCNDLFVIGGHSGTHLDAISHVARNNIVANNIDIKDLQDYQNGLKVMGIETTGPVVKRGILIDIPQLMGLGVLPHDFGIGKEEIQKAVYTEGVEIREDDVVLVRTGWIQYWDDRPKYVSGILFTAANSTWQNAKFLLPDRIQRRMIKCLLIASRVMSYCLWKTESKLWKC
jgi:kynurenine formamidase